VEEKEECGDVDTGKKKKKNRISQKKREKKKIKAGSAAVVERGKIRGEMQARPRTVRSSLKKRAPAMIVERNAGDKLEDNLPSHWTRLLRSVDVALHAGLVVPGGGIGAGSSGGEKSGCAR